MQATNLASLDLQPLRLVLGDGHHGSGFVVVFVRGGVAVVVGGVVTRGEALMADARLRMAVAEIVAFVLTRGEVVHPTVF